MPDDSWQRREQHARAAAADEWDQRGRRYFEGVDALDRSLYEQLLLERFGTLGDLAAERLR